MIGQARVMASAYLTFHICMARMPERNALHGEVAIIGSVVDSGESIVTAESAFSEFTRERHSHGGTK